MSIDPVVEEDEDELDEEELEEDEDDEELDELELDEEEEDDVGVLQLSILKEPVQLILAIVLLTLAH